MSESELVQHTNRPVHVGCTNFGRIRQQYYRRFGGIELTDTFLMPPRKRTLMHWRMEAPRDFAFVVRAWQLITHEADQPTYRRLPQNVSFTASEIGAFKDTATVRQAFQRTEEVAEVLEAKVIFFETPAAFTPTAQNRAAMQRFFEQADRTRGWKFAWQPRGIWAEQEVMAICRDLNILPTIETVQGLMHALEFRFVPYIRINNQIREDELYEMSELLKHVNEGYCFFNNMHCFADALRLQRLLYVE